MKIGQILYNKINANRKKWDKSLDKKKWDEILNKWIIVVIKIEIPYNKYKIIAKYPQQTA